MTGQVCAHIQTLDDHPKVRQNSASMKSSIPRYTWYNSVYTSMKSLYWYIYGVIQIWPSYTELYWVIRVSGFQMYCSMGDFIDTGIRHIWGWFSNVWICTHACPLTRHRDLESKVKKQCADYDFCILSSGYNRTSVFAWYIPVWKTRGLSQGHSRGLSQGHLLGLCLWDFSLGLSNGGIKGISLYISRYTYSLVSILSYTVAWEYNLPIPGPGNGDILVYTSTY